MILKNAITGYPVEIPVRRCFPDSQATFSAADSEEDLQPMIFPLLQIATLTPPDPCQYEFCVGISLSIDNKIVKLSYSHRDHYIISKIPSFAGFAQFEHAENIPQSQRLSLFE